MTMQELKDKALEIRNSIYVHAARGEGRVAGQFRAQLDAIHAEISRREGAVSKNGWPR